MKKALILCFVMIFASFSAFSADELNYEKIYAIDDEIVSDMKDVPDLKLKPVLPKVSEVIEANSNFETKGVHASMLCHKGQPSLSAVASNCEHRAIGTGGGFGYRSLKDELDIALLDSVILAYWACSKAKVKKKQVISY